MSAEFDARPFAAGTVVGLRSFRTRDCPCGCGSYLKVDPGLYAATQPFRWAAGENLAACTKPTDFFFGPADPDHRVAQLNCTCGFYAYFGERNDYRGRYLDMATGIVEGYGTVTIGHLGFRASKARIVALVAPNFDASAVFAQFPTVPVYTTVEEALKAHPTTKPEDVGINPDEYANPEPSRYAMGGWVAGGWSISGPVFTTTSNTQALQQALDRASAALARAGLSIRQVGKAVEEEQRGGSPEMTPLERKRAAAEAAAEQRRRAGLRNSGGFDRRGRRN